MDIHVLTNCIETRAVWPRSIIQRSFVYIDGKGAESARFFKKHGIKRLDVEHADVYADDENYRVVFVNVMKKDVQIFFDALCDLERSMELLGYKNYSEVCKRVMSFVIKIDKDSQK